MVSLPCSSSSLPILKTWVDMFKFDAGIHSGILQHMAMIGGSTSPVTFAGTGGVVRVLQSKTAWIPPASYRLHTSLRLLLGAWLFS